ncbi:unnamed protein product [Boreogadus saida]
MGPLVRSNALPLRRWSHSHSHLSMALHSARTLVRCGDHYTNQQRIMDPERHPSQCHSRSVYSQKEDGLHPPVEMTRQITAQTGGGHSWTQREIEEKRDNNSPKPQKNPGGGGGGSQENASPSLVAPEQSQEVVHQDGLLFYVTSLFRRRRSLPRALL